MRVALLLSGQVRSFADNWPSFQRHILDKLPTSYVDVFCHAPDEPESRILLDYDFRQVLIEKMPLIPDQQYRRVADMPGKPWYPPAFVAQAHLRRLCALRAVGRMMASTEMVQGWKYDWAIRARYDIEFTSDLEDISTFDPAFIYVPKFASWGGINDRFAVGTSEAIWHYCDAWSTKDDALREQGRMHSESHCHWHLKNTGHWGIARTSILFDTVRHGHREPPKFDPYWGDVCD